MKNEWTQWIGGITPEGWSASVRPAPYFRRSWQAPDKWERALVRVCGLGFYELYLNGVKVGDHVLDPIVTQYDVRVRFVTYDVTTLLHAEENVFGAILGNGWYNCHTSEVWNFEKAYWRDHPKLWLELEVDGEVVLRTDQRWRTTTGPILFDALRNGEHYDARLELGDWCVPGVAVDGWHIPPVVQPPGGVMEEQSSPACKIMQVLPLKTKTAIPGGWKVDFGQNLAGWTRIRVKGPAGAQVRLQHLEKPREDHAGEVESNAEYILSGEYQTDRYTLKGDGVEVWEPRFTYHGFRYTLVTSENPAVELVDAEACAIWSSFAAIGSFDSGNELLNQLNACAHWSYVSNFVGIPTDCPHREKNGWTGDAQLAVETGLWFYAAGTSYAQWLQTWQDAQRPSGQLAAIAPSAGWGYNWASGPAWDSAFLTIPWYIYVFTGDDSVIREHFEAMRRYMDFCAQMATGDLVNFGLGDWCAPGCVSGRVEVEFIASSWYYADACLMAKFARLLDQPELAETYQSLATRIQKAFNKRFYHGDGVYGKGSITELACALYQGLTTPIERGPTEVQLIGKVLEKECVADFGIMGARYTLRALAMAGRVDLGYRMLVQEKFPGWGYWVKEFNVTTLLEHWEGDCSGNHIMFGDFAAWCMQFLAGITPDADRAGFAYFTIQPNVVPGLDRFRGWHESRYGRIESAWEFVDGSFTLQVTIPPGTSAGVILPDGRREEVGAGEWKFSVK